MPFRRAGPACLAVFGLLVLAGCGTVGFDPAAYQAAVQLKYETLALIDQSSGRYAPNKAAAESLLRKYADAAEATGKGPANESITQQWAAIRDPRGVSAGNLIEVWKKAPLPPGRRAEKKRAIAQHFDHLICLESSKQAPAECGEVGSVPEASATAPAAIAPAPKPAPRRGAAPKPPDADEPEPEPEQPPK